jgi:hypothetical protein
VCRMCERYRDGFPHRVDACASLILHRAEQHSLGR